jgi:hypothetical protein
MAKSKRRPLAVFGIMKLRKLADFMLKVLGIRGDIAANVAIFVTPNPTVAAVTGHLNALVAAEALVLTRAVGAPAARDLKYDVVLDDMHAWENYVQDLADAAPDEPTAISIIAASGFGLKLHGVHVKPPLALKQDAQGIRLTAKAAGKRAAYEWQRSIDNGATWENLTSTLEAKTVDPTMVQGQRVIYRFRGILKTGANAYCNPVSIIVQ